MSQIRFQTEITASNLKKNNREMDGVNIEEVKKHGNAA